MRMRKLFAGIAATAALLGGAALGATSAQAAQARDITINNAQIGHRYTSHRFANLKINTSTNPQSVDVTTMVGWNDTLKKALGWDALAQDVRTMYDSNPAAYVATLDANGKAFRDFAAKLSAVGGSDGSVIANSAGRLKLPVTGDGWYLVTDSVTQNGKSVYGTQAIVATTLDGMTGTFPVKGDSSTGQGNITAVGEFNAKNDPSTPDKPVSKTVKKGGVSVDGGSVSVGDELTYTIATKVPDIAVTSSDAHFFTIYDVSKKGLKLPSDKSGFNITMDGKDISSLFTFRQVGDTGRGLTTVFGITDKGRQFVPMWAGKTVSITYTAKVYQAAVESGKVENTASVTTKFGVFGVARTVSYTYDVSFTKTDPQGNPLAGATFEMTDASGKLIRGTTTRENGVIPWRGLAAGTYTVKETKAPAGYSSSFLPTFKVIITQNADKSATVTTEGDVFGLVCQNKDTHAIRVKNVKSVAQLPLTGAAGAALFTVVALLVAGVGTTVVLKARSKSAMV